MAAQIVAVANQKGGVGKTTVTVNLAAALATAGRRVLVVDADPQGNATTHLGIQEPPFTLADVLTVDPGTRQVEPGVIAGSVVPAGEGWAGIEAVAADIALANREQDQDLGRETRLRTALEGTLDRWDIVLVDCPPSLGQLTVNALTAADSALLVTEPRAASVDGLAQMTRTLASVRRHLNSGLRLGGVIVNRYRADRRDRVEWVEQLRTDYGDQVLEPFIPDREIVAVAASAEAPLSAYGRSARDVTAAVDALAGQLLPVTAR